MTKVEDTALPAQPLVRGPTTLWFQLAERLASAITGGSLKPGDQLPTETELMKLFAVGRSTVRAGLKALELEGLIWRGQGKGTFVAKRPADQPSSRLAGFHEDTLLRGLTPSAKTRRIELLVPPSSVAARLGQEDTDSAIFIERLLLADGELIGMHRSILPEWVLEGGEPFRVGDLDKESLYALLDARSDSSPARATQTVEAVAASPELSELLEVNEGTPLLKLERLCYDRFGRPVEFVELWYRADRYRLSIELTSSPRHDPPPAWLDIGH